jgi:hypothetical protein
MSNQSELSDAAGVVNNPDASDDPQYQLLVNLKKVKKKAVGMAKSESFSESFWHSHRASVSASTSAAAGPAARRFTQRFVRILRFQVPQEVCNATRMPNAF